MFTLFPVTTRKANKPTAESLVKALGLPKSNPQRVNTDPLGWDEAPFKPPIPLMPQYVKGDERWVVDSPKLTKGIIPLKRVALSLGVQVNEIMSGALLPNQQAVILRPYDLRIQGNTGLIANMVDDFQTSFDDRYRLRLPKGVMATLNLVSDNEIVLVYGQRFQFTNSTVKRGSGAKEIPLLYLFNPMKFIPDGLEESLTW